jgi:hypothetical protein
VIIFFFFFIRIEKNAPQSVLLCGNPRKINKSEVEDLLRYTWIVQHQIVTSNDSTNVDRGFGITNKDFTIFGTFEHAYLENRCLHNRSHEDEK